VALNFDAKLSLDVSEFLASINKAETAVRELREQLTAPMKMPGTTGAGGTDKGLETLTQQRQRASQETMRQMTEEQAMARAASQMERNNAKTEWQAEMMRKKAMDDRIKDHQTLSSLSDQTIAQEQKARAQASASIKNQMQEREAMNKQHAQANAMNDRFDASRKAGADASLRNSARERYALYDVAAAYQQVQQIATQALTAMIGTATQYERAFANVVRTTEFTSIKIGQAAKNMQYSLTQLAENIPVSFGNITEIATIGNQLGIAQGELTNFTKTVAQFSTITGISVDQAALSFGRIGELLGKAGETTNFDALGSAIAYAGVKAVATETQILSVTKEIATTAKMAKFTTAETIGLATALSSLGIAPEAARGSIIRSFALINQAVGAGGDKLKAYADIAGQPAEIFAKTWSTNGEKAFGQFLKGLQQMSDSGQNLDTVLRGLGVQNVRDIQTIQKLGDNYNVYSESIKNANKGFEDATFLGAAYGQIQETVAAKIQIVQNKFDNFLASAGQISFPGLNILLDVIGTIIDQLNAFARNPFGKVVIGFTTVALALAGAIAAINAVVLIGKATMMAYAVAMETTALAGSAATASTVTLGAAATATTVGINAATIALRALQIAGKATIWLAGIYTAVQAISMLGDAYEKATDSSSYFIRKAEESLSGFAGMQEALAADYAAALAKYGSEAAVGAAIVREEVYGMTAAMQSNTEASIKAGEIANGYATVLGVVKDKTNIATGALEKQNIVLGANYTAWLKNQIVNSGNFKDVAGNKGFISSLEKIGYSFEDLSVASQKGEKGIKDYFTTLYLNSKGKLSNNASNDFRNNLQALQVGAGPIAAISNALLGANANAFLLGNGLGQVANAITTLPEPTKFIETTKSLEKARTIWDYIAEVQGKLKTAFDWRYSAKNAADELYSGWKKVADSFKETNKALRDLKTGMSGLVADRSILEYQLSVAIRYGDTLRANAIQAELNANADKMAENKAQQATATQNASRALKGNSDAAIRNRQTMQGLVTSSMAYLTSIKTTSKDTATLINNAKTLKTDFMDQGKALGYNSKELETYAKSFDDFIAIINGTSDQLDVSMKTYLTFDAADASLHKWKTDNADLSITTKLLNPDWISWKKLNKQTLEIETKLVPSDAEIAVYHKNQHKGATTLIKAFEDTYGKGFATGGLVTGPGNGTSDSIRANLSNGEYVINAATVSRVGVGFLNALNNQQDLTMPASSAVSMSSTSGSSIVYLSPDDRALLRAAIDRPINLYTENARIAQSANDGNVLLAQRGRN